MQGKTTRAAVLTALLALTTTVPSWGAEKGNDQGRPDTAPGQEKQAGEPADPQPPEGRATGQGSEGSTPATPRKATPPAKGRSERSAPKSHGTSGGSHGKAHRKTTICHATGSSTNPYVTITISDAALAAHRRHQDGRDIVPAPAGGCPKGSSAPTSPDAKKTPKEGKVTLCHATGSSTNPYVTITISENAVDAHRAHQDGRDIIPAPANGCPDGQPAGASAATGGPALAAAGVQAAAPLAAPRGGVLGEQEESGVLGEMDEDRGPLGAVRAAGADIAGARLPFTGVNLWVALVAGLAMALGGIALHRSITSRTSL